MADVITRLKVESTEYDSKIKRASQGLLQMEQACRKVGGTLAVLEKDELEFVKGLGKMETVSKDARGQIGELTKAFTDLSMMYKRLTDEEKQGDFGKALSASLGELKTRIQDTKKDLASINQELSGSKFGQFGSIIDGIGHKMGVSANLTELLTSKTALMTAGIGAAVAAIYKGTEAWTKYNAELSKQDQQTQVITGLDGFAADHMTDTMRALSDTYKVDFRQAVEAANTLMSQFGVSGDEAIRLIKDGMQGMILGDGPKLLSMIQQYAPAFRDAGVSASQLVAVIHNSEGGIFTDQNMNAIVMGIKNIRLMTNQTSEALAKMGIDGNQMSQQLSNGTLTVFDALRQVASKLKDVDSNSKTAGEVMQTVFGRQGAMAGTNLAKAIETLNTNLEETKKQTGELGDAFAELQTANEKLNTAIRDAFSYDGWEQMATGIKAKLVSALADVLNILDGIRVSWGDLMDKIGIGGGKNNYMPVGGGLYNFLPRTTREPSEKADELKKSQDKKTTYDRQVSAYNKQIDEKRQQINAMTPGDGMPDLMKDTRENLKAEIQDIEKIRDKYKELAKDILSPPKTKPDQNEPSFITKPLSKTVKELNPMQQAQKQISTLTEEALTADEGRLEVIKKEIAALQEQVNVYKSIQDFVQGKKPNWNIQVGDRKTFEAEQRKSFEEEVGTPSRLQSMEYSVMQEIKAENIKVDTETLHTLLKDALQNSIDTTSLDLTSIAEQIGEGVNVPDEKWQEILDKYNELRAAIGEEPIEINFETGKDKGKDKPKTMKSEWTDAASAVQSLGSALQGLEDPAAKVMGIVAQAIATVALTFSKSLSGTVTPWDWIAAAVAGTATMISTITAIKSATKMGYADGGIVAGNSYSGDNILATNGRDLIGLNAGEVVLNAAQQNNLAERLQSDERKMSGALPFVTGEKIVLGVNNWARSTGRGELVFSKR